MCHLCNEAGHKAMYCNKSTPEQRAEQARIENEPFFKKFTMQTKIGKMYMQQILAGSDDPLKPDAEKSRLFRTQPKPLEEVTCFKVCI